MSKRILFVDDEPMVLSGLRRSLRGMRNEWEMEFVTSGLQALEVMGQKPFDVVVTDMRMPGMDGAELLEQVKNRFPQSVRFVLSGQSDREAILRSVGPTHQYLSKPCEADQLQQKIRHACALRELLDNPHLKEVVSRLQTLPSLPAPYAALSQALESSDVSPARLAKIVSQDMAMTLKVLQMVNSAFFGVPCEVSSPQQAVSLLGIENVKSLLSVGIFARLPEPSVDGLSFLWTHSLQTSAFARLIARVQNAGPAMEEQAFTAGLLHDVGQLVLISVCHDQYQQVLDGARKRERSILELEQEVFGCTHAEVGAYLLGLWGLPAPIVEAVAWHHMPSRAGSSAFSPVIAVHAADVLDHLRRDYRVRNEKPHLDEDLLNRLGLHEQVKVWSSICRDAGPEGKIQ